MGTQSSVHLSVVIPAYNEALRLPKTLSQSIEYLKSQRDLYKYLHDQTLRLANHGLNKEEIAEQLDLPPALGQKFHNRGYYGSVHHNVCAVYVKYLGHFDGNPANIHRHPPAAAGYGGPAASRARRGDSSSRRSTSSVGR